MPSRKALILFFVLVAVVYGVLLIPWPGVLSGYRAAVAEAGNMFFRRIGDGRIAFETMEAPTLDKDTEVILMNISTRKGGMLGINARRLYLPTAFTFALIAATPIAWRRKLVAVSLGLTLISVYVGFGVWLKLIYFLSDPGINALSLGPSLRRAIFVLMTILTRSPVTPYIAALLVFVLVTVRREDVVRLGSAAMKTRHAPSPATAA